MHCSPISTFFGHSWIRWDYKGCEAPYLGIAVNKYTQNQIGGTTGDDTYAHSNDDRLTPARSGLETAFQTYHCSLFVSR